MKSQVQSLSRGGKCMSVSEYAKSFTEHFSILDFIFAIPFSVTLIKKLRIFNWTNPNFYWIEPKFLLDLSDSPKYFTENGMNFSKRLHDLVNKVDCMKYSGSLKLI